MTPIDKITEVAIVQEEMSEFINSSQSVIRGYHSGLTALYFDKAEGVFYIYYVLHIKPSSSVTNNNVLFFKEKAFDFPDNTFIVEDVAKLPKAFYYTSDGAKKELHIKQLSSSFIDVTSMVTSSF